MRRATRRRWIVLVGLLCLLFQQVAVAAYRCQIDLAPVAASSVMAGCHDMAPAPADASALCAKHCHPDQARTADPGQLSIPALALPPLRPWLVAWHASTPAPPTAVRIARSDPPPRLRYCSLLI